MLARETSVYIGANMETFDYEMVLVEDDDVSQSARDVPDLGHVIHPGIKSCIVDQNEDPPVYTPDELAEFGAAGPPKEVFKHSRTEGGVGSVGTPPSIYLKNALKSAVSTEAMERADRTPAQLRQCVRQLLMLTRPFSFS